MHVYYKFGLLLIFILSVSTQCTRAAPPPPPANQSLSYDDNYPDDYADYYDEIELGGMANATAYARNETIPSIPIASSTSTTTAKPQLPPQRSNHVLEPSCPKACLCLEDYKHIMCNNAALKYVPRGIPSTALIIDLSHNRIVELRDNDFANVSKVREINLSGNHLKTINKEVFEGLTRLQRLRLAENKLMRIETDAFAGASDLSELDLSNNSIVLPKNKPFLIQPGLLKLSCRNCSWNQLYDETFVNLSSLTSLKLDRNDFKKKINTRAFAPLRNLIKLQLPELDQDSVEELCNQLKAIDNISFKHFDISCFELVLGATFNESLIFATDPPYKAPPTIEFVPAPIETETVTEVKTKTKPSAAEPAGGSKKIKTSLKPQSSSEKGEKMAGGNEFLNLTLPTAATGISDADGGVNDTSILTASGIDNSTKIVKASVAVDDKEKVYQVPVSRETINLMLICIMIVAVVGIIIGIIFRKDVGGIKTKCCRTRKPEPKDQVHPTEEIPLNKLA